MVNKWLTTPNGVQWAVSNLQLRLNGGRNSSRGNAAFFKSIGSRQGSARSADRPTAPPLKSAFRFNPTINTSSEMTPSDTPLLACQTFLLTFNSPYPENPLG